MKRMMLSFVTVRNHDEIRVSEKTLYTCTEKRELKNKTTTNNIYYVIDGWRIDVQQYYLQEQRRACGVT